MFRLDIVDWFDFETFDESKQIAGGFLSFRKKVEVGRHNAIGKASRNNTVARHN